MLQRTLKVKFGVRSYSLFFLCCLGILLILPSMARAEDVSLASGETIQIAITSPLVTYTITSTTGVDKIVVNGALITFTLSSGDSVVVTNSNGYQLFNSLDQSTLCGANNQSTATFTSTVTLTAKTDVVCSSGSGGGGSSGGSSPSGGGGAAKPAPTPTPKPSATPTPKPTPTTQATPKPTVTLAPSAPFTPTEGTIVKEPGKSTVYLLEGGKLRPFLNGRIFMGHGKKFEDVKEFDLSAFKTGETVSLFPDSYNFTCGQLVKASNAKVYIVSKCEDGQQKEITWIETEEAFLKAGWSFKNLNLISDAKKADFGEASSFNKTITHPAGTLVKYRSSSKIYLLRVIDGNIKKSWVATEAEFNRKNLQWSDIVTIPSSESYSDGPNLGGAVLGVSTSSTLKSFLKLGSTGDEVRVLQDLLKDLGYLGADVTSTGYFGQATKKAVMEFQKANGIQPLGHIGPATRSALNKELGN